MKEKVSTNSVNANNSVKQNEWKALTNWRLYAISAMATVAFILTMCESDDKFAFYATKVVAVAIALLAIYLCRRWQKRGQIDDVIKFLDGKDGQNE